MLLHLITSIFTEDLFHQKTINFQYNSVQHLMSSSDSLHCRSGVIICPELGSVLFIDLTEKSMMTNKHPVTTTFTAPPPPLWVSCQFFWTPAWTLLCLPPLATGGKDPAILKNVITHKTESPDLSLPGPLDIVPESLAGSVILKLCLALALVIVWIVEGKQSLWYWPFWSKQLSDILFSLQQGSLLLFTLKLVDSKMNHLI